jgi:hypothetical protein
MGIEIGFELLKMLKFDLLKIKKFQRTSVLNIFFGHHNKNFLNLELPKIKQKCIFNNFLDLDIPQIAKKLHNNFINFTKSTNLVVVHVVFSMQLGTPKMTVFS